jgi:hypothetical protein
MQKSRNHIFVVTGVCLFNALILYMFLAPFRKTPVYDLPQFYFAAKLVRSGQIARLYDTEAYRPYINELRRIDPAAAKYSLYFNRPAFEAPLFLPLAFVPFQWATKLIVAANAFLLGLVVWFLPKWFLGGHGMRMWLFAFMPFLYSITLGQDTLLFTLIVAFAFYRSLHGEDGEAGVVLALALFKPHLLLAVPLAMAASRRWKLLGSFLAMGAALGFASFALVGWHGLQLWLRLLQAPTTDAVPWMMGNVRGLGIHLGSGMELAAAGVTAAAYLWTLRAGSYEQRLAAALLAGLLLSPHTYVQDYSTLAVVALIALHPALEYVWLLPWAYFHPTLGNKSMVPFVLLAVASLVSLPAFPFLKRLRGGIQRQEPGRRRVNAEAQL